MLSIAYLADCPEQLPTVAGWIYHEWGEHMPGITEEDARQFFRQHLNRERIPLTLVAFWDGQPAGTASIYLHDMDIRPDLTPWLAAVYVAVAFRKRGVGSALVEAVENAARKLEIERLYLFTPDQEHFYARLGWTVLDRVEYRGESNVIMEKEMR